MCATYGVPVSSREASEAPIHRLPEPRRPSVPAHTGPPLLPRPVGPTSPAGPGPAAPAHRRCAGWRRACGSTRVARARCRGGGLRRRSPPRATVAPAVGGRPAGARRLRRPPDAHTPRPSPRLRLRLHPPPAPRPAPSTPCNPDPHPARRAPCGESAPTICCPTARLRKYGRTGDDQADPPHPQTLPARNRRPAAIETAGHPPQIPPALPRPGPHVHYGRPLPRPLRCIRTIRSIRTIPSVRTIRSVRMRERRGVLVPTERTHEKATPGDRTPAPPHPRTPRPPGHPAPPDTPSGRDLTSRWQTVNRTCPQHPCPAATAEASLKHGITRPKRSHYGSSTGPDVLRIEWRKSSKPPPPEEAETAQWAGWSQKRRLILPGQR
jgi:hypothetical protein